MRRLERLILQYTDAAPRSRPRVISGDLPNNGDHHAQELDTATAHTLDESFTWTRPYGFTLQSLEVTGVATWRELYGALCHALAEHDPVTFHALPDNDTFLSSHGYRDFARTPSGLREALPVSEDIFAELHFSANSIRDNIRRLLNVFAFEPHDMRVYLRQERDASGDSVA